MLEAYLHKAIIDDTCMNSNGRFNRKWHRLFGMIWGLIYILIFLCVFPEWQGLAIGACSRYFIFPSLLNYLREKPFGYVSNKGMDRLLYKLSPKIRRRIFFVGSSLTVIWCFHYSFSVLF